MNHEPQYPPITAADGNVFQDLGVAPAEAEQLHADSQHRIADKLARRVAQPPPLALPHGDNTQDQSR